MSKISVTPLLALLAMNFIDVIAHRYFQFQKCAIGKQIYRYFCKYRSFLSIILTEIFQHIFQDWELYSQNVESQKTWKTSCAIRVCSLGQEIFLRILYRKIGEHATQNYTSKRCEFNVILFSFMLLKLMLLAFHQNGFRQIYRDFNNGRQ